MDFSRLHKEFSTDLGFFEGNFGLHDFPKIESGEPLAVARQEIAEGRPAYLKATKGDRNLMVYLKPEREGVVTARVVPGLHYVTSHGLGIYVGHSDRLESFASILTNGFVSPAPGDNVVLLTSNYVDEKWQSGYPVENCASKDYMGKGNTQEKGEVKGDSLRIVLWSGFSGFNNAKVSKSGVGGDIRPVWRCPTTDLEGVVVTAPGSNWGKRVDFYRSLYEHEQLLAPIDLYDVNGRHEHIGKNLC